MAPPHIAAADMAAVIAADKAHVWHHLIQHKPYEQANATPRIIVHGSGMRIRDAMGKEYIDAVSGGVWTVNVGYGRQRIADAVSKQLVEMNYFAGAGGSVPQAMFSKMLIEKMPGMSRVYYCNSGSEANEKVIKMVRQISQKHHNGKKWKILYRERDYHGTTIGTLATSGQLERAAQYGPYPDGFVIVPHCLEYRKQWDVEQAQCAGPETITIFAINVMRLSGTARAQPTPSSRSFCRRGRIPSAAWCWNPSRRAAESSSPPRATGLAFKKSASGTTFCCTLTRSCAVSAALACGLATKTSA